MLLETRTVAAEAWSALHAFPSPSGVPGVVEFPVVSVWVGLAVRGQLSVVSGTPS